MYGASSAGAGPSSSPRQHGQPPQQASTSTPPINMYTFSVHQPYTNWPHVASTAPYAPAAWYPVPHHAYSVPQNYRDKESQTESPDPPLGSTRSTTPPRFRRHWDAIFSTFLKSAGLWEALRGFEDDMIVMNDEWERDQVPPALDTLIKDLTDLPENELNEKLPEKSLEYRKLEYVRTANGVEPQTPTAITKSISRFIAQSRQRNDASNKAEFLLSLAEKRRRSNKSGESISTSAEPNDGPSSIPSCARTDAKPLERDVQMKYDIAKNDDGPLKRTMKIKNEDSHEDTSLLQKRKRGVYENRENKMDVTAARHPGLAERLSNVETHLAVRYVPSPPHSLLDRLKFIEEHIIQLEKDYPPWAALHFNQPHRGWPPPPRPKPLIVPSHLTSHGETESSHADGAGSTKGRSGGRTKSSLHRAVMERLEVQKAIGDLAGSSGGPSGATGT